MSTIVWGSVFLICLQQSLIQEHNAFSTWDMPGSVGFYSSLCWRAIAMRKKMRPLTKKNIKLTTLTRLYWTLNFIFLNQHTHETDQQEHDSNKKIAFGLSVSPLMFYQHTYIRLTVDVSVCVSRRGPEGCAWPQLNTRDQLHSKHVHLLCPCVLVSAAEITASLLEEGPTEQKSALKEQSDVSGHWH